ncbi:MAG: right-handed parallel beta-helix repeat-containing protein [Thermoleophilia bacterium]
MLLAPAAQAAVHTIAADGTGCAAIGTWDAGSTTCTMTADIAVGVGQDAIEITGNNVTLEGAGHTLTGGYAGGVYDGSDGVYVQGLTGVSVLNLKIRNFSMGVRYFGSTSGDIKGNDVFNCLNGVYLTQSAHNNNVIANNVHSNIGEGVYVWNSDSNTFSINNFIANTPQAWVGGTSVGNNFTMFGVYGNYWDDWDSRVNPENCVNNSPFDNSCDTAYVFTGGTDTRPLVLPGGSARHDWTWYDNVGADNWILLANRPGSGNGAIFNLFVGGSPITLAQLGSNGPGYAADGKVVYNKYAGLMDGPVFALVQGEDTWTVASQRSLWPKGGNSLEEVPGVMVMDSQFCWTWYDMKSAGFKNWILVSNPNSYPVHYRITIGNETKVPDSIVAAGDNVDWMFPGERGGPVRVTAWDDYGDPVYIMASQRVLSNNAMAFNEVPGQPRSGLSSDNVWTWYDQKSPGAQNWVLIANPTINGDIVTYNIYYKIFIAGAEVDSGGPIAPGGYATSTFPGLRDGPVEVKTYANSNFTGPVPAVTSQRTIWGPSFEEVPGADRNNLWTIYNWTWYDQKSPGARNWVLVSNPSATDTITATVTFPDQPSGMLQTLDKDIGPGGSAYWMFPGKMGGPVEAKAVVQGGSWANFGDRREIIASQRVLWNGFFNEVWGQ